MVVEDAYRRYYYDAKRGCSLLADVWYVKLRGYETEMPVDVDGGSK